MTRLALVGDGVAVDYDALREHARRARALALGEAGPGAVVALRPAVDVSTAIWVAAALEGGLTLLLQHPALPEAELARQRQVAGARWVAPSLTVSGSEPGAIDDWSPAARTNEAPRSDARTDDASLARVSERAGERASEDDEQVPLAIAFTSGTTGRPRAAVLSRRAFVAAARASEANLGWRDDDRWLLSLPPAHVGGLSVLVRAFLARRTVVLGPPRFDARGFGAAVERHRVTLASIVPTMLHRLLDEGWRPPASFRAVLVGGAAAPPSLLARAWAAGVPALPTYGMTETCAQVATRAPGDLRADPDVGAPLDGVEVRVRGGVLEVRGPTLFDGYLGEPSPFDAEGWFSTGDLAALDDAGHLVVLGRRGDLIVRGGENVYPARVEAALVADPRIDAAMVVGVPDDEWGERVAAAVVASDEAGALAALREAPLAPFERPTRVAFVPALPTNAMGKPDRRGLSVRWREVPK
ncbi:MAG: AMP-binding protein [Myxococcales bacterium]|nr:AMP-binding protein [Myxococcales bacterium]